MIRGVLPTAPHRPDTGLVKGDARVAYVRTACGSTRGRVRRTEVDMTTDKYVEEPIEARPRSMHVIPAGLGGLCAEMAENMMRLHLRTSPEVNKLVHWHGHEALVIREE